MRVEVVKCDACGKEHNAKYMLPSEWIETIQNKTYGTQEVQHFCSKGCLIQWAKQEDERA